MELKGYAGPYKQAAEVMAAYKIIGQMESQAACRQKGTELNQVGGWEAATCRKRRRSVNSQPNVFRAVAFADLLLEEESHHRTRYIFSPFTYLRKAKPESARDGNVLLLRTCYSVRRTPYVLRIYYSSMQWMSAGILPTGPVPSRMYWQRSRSRLVSNGPAVQSPCHSSLLMADS